MTSAEDATMDKLVDDVSVNETSDIGYIFHSLKDTAMTVHVKIVLYVLVVVASLFGNGSLIIVICKTGSLRTKFNWYIVHLAVVDILMVSVCSWLHIVASSEDQWVMGKFFCKTHNFFQGKGQLLLSLILHKRLDSQGSV